MHKIRYARLLLDKIGYRCFNMLEEPVTSESTSNNFFLPCDVRVALLTHLHYFFF